MVPPPPAGLLAAAGALVAAGAPPAGAFPPPPPAAPLPPPHAAMRLIAPAPTRPIRNSRRLAILPSSDVDSMVRGTHPATGHRVPPASRRSGVLLHPTSLPSPFGIGDLGPAAYQFLEFLARAGQSLWQVLPLGPTGYGNSPYAAPSAFARNL